MALAGTPVATGQALLGAVMTSPRCARSAAQLDPHGSAPTSTRASWAASSPRAAPRAAPSRAAVTLGNDKNSMGRNSTRGHPSPWPGRARAEAELPHIDPRRGVLSAELGLTRVERTEWLRAKPPRGRAAELRVWGAPIGSAPRTFRLAPSA